MNLIWKELKLLKEQQNSDFHATVLGLTALRDGLRTVRQDVGTVKDGLGSVESGVVTLVSSLEAYQRTCNARFDKLEEAIRLLGSEQADAS